MYRNTLEITHAWSLQRKKGQSGYRLWTDGAAVFHYNTCLLAHDTDFGLILNVTKYSPSTSAHQNGIREFLETAGLRYAELSGMVRGCSPQDLRYAITDFGHGSYRPLDHPLDPESAF